VVAQDPDVFPFLSGVTATPLDRAVGATPFQWVSPRSIFGLLAVAAVVAACDDGLGPVSGPPARVVLAAGDSQVGAVGTPLGVPIRARVLDAAGSPVWLTTVRFFPAGGSGSTSPVVATTDATGEVTTSWTLGPLVGPHRLRAVALDGPPEAQVLVTATGYPGPAARLFQVVGITQSGFPNETLTTPLLTRVADFFGNGVAGVAVRYTILRGGGQLSAAEAVTDTSGITSVLWTLGPEVTGIPDSVQAEVDGLQGSPLYFVAFVLPP